MTGRNALVRRRAGRTEVGQHAVRRSGVTRLVAALAVPGAALLVSSVALTALVHAHPGQSVSARIFRGLRHLTFVDGEGNAWSWYSSLLLAALALSFLGHAAVQRAHRGQYAPYAVLGLVALYMSLDEAAVLHEKLSKLVPASRSQFQWLFAGIPLAVVAGLVVLWVARRIDATMRRRLVVAGLVYLSGAVITETIEAVVVLSADSKHAALASLSYAFSVALEEGLEVAGVLLALRATLLQLHVRVAQDAGLLLDATAGPGAPAAAGDERARARAAHAMTS